MTNDETVCRKRRHELLARDGQRQTHIYKLEDGWACSYRMLTDGRRQITALYLPGEYCEPQWVLRDHATQPVVALTDIKLTRIPVSHIRQDSRGPDRATGLPDMKAMSAAILAELDRQTEWIVGLGRKTGLERISAILCEIVDRSPAGARATDGRCAVPLTQTDLADIVGLTPIHVNRTLKTLREGGLIDWKGKWLTVPDLENLRRAASGLPTKPANARAPAKSPWPALAAGATSRVH